VIYKKPKAPCALLCWSQNGFFETGDRDAGGVTRSAAPHTEFFSGLKFVLERTPFLNVLNSYLSLIAKQ
jgi:hypothetical protein